MKKIIITASLSVGLLMLSVPSYAATSNVDVTGTVLTALSATNTGVNFGYFSTSGAPGTMVAGPVSGSCNPSATGGVTYVSGASCGTFSITGTSGATVTMTVSTPAFNMENASDNTKTITGTIGLAGLSGGGTGTCLIGSTCDDVRIGGVTASITAATATAGIYSTATGSGSPAVITLDYS